MSKRKGGGGNAGGQPSAKRPGKTGRSGKGGTMAQKMANHSLDQAAHSKDKRADQRRRLRLKQLQRSMARAEEELREFMVLADGTAAPKKAVDEDRSKRGKKQPYLKGAARPWASLQTSEHGCGRRVFECDDWCDPDWRTEQPTTEVDLFEDQLGKFGVREETRAYCR